MSKKAKARDYQTAVIDALMVSHIYQKKHDEDARVAVNDLMAWEGMVSLDPTVSQGARLMLNERDSQWRDAILDACRRHGIKEIGDEILSDMGAVEA